MNFKETNAHLTIILMLLFAAVASYAGIQENPLVKAIQLYDAKNYTEAEQVLKILLDEKPDHLMVNYYYGACRTENGHYGTNEIIYLLNGSTGEAPLKTNYYLAVQYHAKNRFDEALKHYTKYKSSAGIDEQKEVKLSEKIQQCSEKINPFENENKTIDTDVLPAPIPREKEIEEYKPIISKDSVTTDDSTKLTESLVIDSSENTAAIIPEESIKIAPKFEPINFVVNGELTYLDTTHFRTKKGLKYYTERKQKQKKLEQKIKEVDMLREKYGSTNSYEEKQAIGKNILAAETDNYQLQNETNQLLIQAKEVEIEYWENVSSDEKEAFKKKLKTYSKSIHKLEVVEEIALDTSQFINPNILLTSPNIASQTEKVIEDELIYKIQLGAYSRGLPSYKEKSFKKLSYIRKIENYTDEKGVVVYTTGNLTSYDDALKMQNQVRQEGVEDAFVVPYFNGKRITLKEAKEIEAGR